MDPKNKMEQLKLTKKQNSFLLFLYWNQYNTHMNSCPSNCGGHSATNKSCIGEELVDTKHWFETWRLAQWFKNPGSEVTGPPYFKLPSGDFSFPTAV
jgi:hypothetical protein